MIYDPNNREYFFSEEMILSEESSRQLSEQFKSWQAETVSNPVSLLQATFKTPQEQNVGKMVLMLIPGLSLFIGLIAAVMCLPVKRYDIMAFLLAGVLLMPGIITFLFPGTRSGYDQSVASNTVSQRLIGIILALGGIALLIVRLTAADVTSVKFMMTLFLVVSVTVFLFSAVAGAGMITSGKNVYSEEVNAKVIGYLRTFDTQNDDGPAPAIYTPTVSPVFEYYYDGSKYQAAYDVFYNGKDSDIPLGTTCPIRICPTAPMSIQGNTKKMTSGPIAFGLLGLAASVVLLILLLK